MRLRLRRGPDLDRLTEGLDPLEAIDVLTAANRERPRPEIERRLIEVRHRAFDSLPFERASSDGSAAAREALGTDSGLPAVSPDRLDSDVLRAGIERGGCLLVRGLIDRPAAERMVEAIDRAASARDAYRPNLDEAGDEWFEPFEPAPEHADALGKAWNRLAKGGGTVWAADSPRGMFKLLETFEAAGLRELATSYLGARPVLSMKKCVLRRVSPETGTDWHQDGRFLGERLNALNVWAALSPCGSTAPGLDVVAKRLEEIVATGTEGAYFDWSVADGVASEAAEPEGIVRPEFEPGDVLFFDELCLHRTAVSEDMTDPRYAAEVWMFGCGAYPRKQVPLVF